VVPWLVGQAHQGVEGSLQVVVAVLAALLLRGAVEVGASQAP